MLVSVSSSASEALSGRSPTPSSSSGVPVTGRFGEPQAGGRGGRTSPGSVRCLLESIPVLFRIVRLIGLAGELSVSVSDIEARRARFWVPTGGKLSESAIGSEDMMISESMLVFVFEADIADRPGKF